MLGGGTSVPAVAAPRVPTPATEPRRRGRPPGKKTFSAETRAKMAAAQQARWAAKKGTPATAKAPKAASTTTAAEPKKKRVISAAGRKAMALAAKKRWAKARGEAAPF